MLIERYWDRLYRWLYHLTHDRHAAEDLTQETFLKAFAGLNKFRADSNFQAWLFRIGHNNFVNSRRIAARTRQPVPDDLPSHDEGPVEQALSREALELLLGLQSDIEVVASVGDGSSAAEVVRMHKPDVVLMDYRLPGLDGVQATLAVREAYPDVAVVCLTASANLREVDALYAAGAVACLSKDQELDEIVDAIRQAA